MHYNPLAYIKNEADILKFVNALISNTKGEGKEGDPFWTKAETLLYCALLGYIIFEGSEEAVSYTHLDVYKRQAEKSIHLGADSKSIVVLKYFWDIVVKTTHWKKYLWQTVNKEKSV